MAFRELAQGLRLPQGTSERYRLLEALGRMLTGDLYNDMRFAFDQEKWNGQHINLRERRPSVGLNLAYEITQSTLSELFGDEQFPTVKILNNHEEDDKATEELSGLISELHLPIVLSEAYEEGVIGSVCVVVHKADNGLPYYETLPGKWCEPIYRSPYSDELIAVCVTFPASKSVVMRQFPDIIQEDAAENYWYRYIIGPVETIDYVPMSEGRFARLGEKDSRGNIIEFVEYQRTHHGFAGRVPAIYVKNFGGRSRQMDGPCLWWPIKDMCIEIDYTLSQCGRGLRYCADPMIFVKRGDMMAQEMDMAATPTSAQKPAGGMATNVGRDGTMVRGATQVLVGVGRDSDAKLLEISAQGIKEEREFVRDLREYALEVIGGLKTRAEHMSKAESGRAIDKGLRPLRRLVQRQRYPYGDILLLGLIDLTLYGFREGIFDPARLSTNPLAIALGNRMVNSWPNDEPLQGDYLNAHVQGLQLAAGGSPKTPKELIDPKIIGAKLAADLGLKEPYNLIKGSGEMEAPPQPPGSNIVSP